MCLPSTWLSRMLSLTIPVTLRTASDSRPVIRTYTLTLLTCLLLFYHDKTTFKSSRLRGVHGGLMVRALDSRLRGCGGFDSTFM